MCVNNKICRISEYKRFLNEGLCRVKLLQFTVPMRQSIKVKVYWRNVKINFYNHSYMNGGRWPGLANPIVWLEVFDSLVGDSSEESKIFE